MATNKSTLREPTDDRLQPPPKGHRLVGNRESLALLADDTKQADTPLLELNGVTIGFNTGPDVIRHLDLSVERGEFLSVIGPSGCGKSTILNAVAGLLEPRSGSIALHGKPVVGVNTSVGYMTQGDTLMPWRTVHENIALPLKMRKTPKDEVRERVSAVLEMLDLTEARDKYPTQLSGGMKRRALLGRCMIYKPEIILMDEPFAALDAQLRTQMYRELRETVTSLNQTVLFITHDIYEAVLLSDRVIVLGGRPSKPVATFSIPFGAVREPETLRFEDTFVAMERSIHEALLNARS